MTDKMRVYISGPMRRKPEYNFPAFLAAAEFLRKEYPDAVLFSPAQRDLDSGFDPTGLTGNEDLAALGFDLRQALATDMDWIARTATTIYMLKGWSQSSGARAELALAEALGLEVLYERFAAGETTPAEDSARLAGYDDGWSEGYDDGYYSGYDEASMGCS